VARTVVWAATANILTKKGVGVLRDGGCRNGPRPDLPWLRFRPDPVAQVFRRISIRRTERSHWSRAEGETATALTSAILRASAQSLKKGKKKQDRPWQ
jgi:hypothetical protein